MELKRESMILEKITTRNVVIVFCLLFAYFFFGSVYDSVPPGHRGISVTMGKVSDRLLGEGFTWKKPLVETIVKIPIKQLSIQSNATSFSSDLQTVTVKYVVLYRLPQSRVIELYQQYDGDPYIALVEPRVQEAVKQVASNFKAEEIVKKRDEIKKQVFEKVLAQVSGIIEVRDIPITNIDLTDELEKAIELKQVTEQQALAKQYELQKAQKEAEITIVNAKAEAESVKIKGDALKQSQEVIQLEIAKKWNGISPQTVVVGVGGANVLLPLK